MIRDEIPLSILNNNTDYCFYPRMWTYMPKLMEKSCLLPFPQTMPSIRLVSAHCCKTLHVYFPQNQSHNITINDKMIFEIRPTITLPLQSSLTTSVVWWWQRDLAKVCYMFRVFICLLIRQCFFIFSFPSSSLWPPELTCSITMQRNSRYIMISLKNRQFDRKCLWQQPLQVPIQRLYSLTHEILYNHPKTWVMNVNQLPWEFTHDYTVSILMCLWNGQIFYAGILIYLYCL